MVEVERFAGSPQFQQELMDLFDRSEEDDPQYETLPVPAGEDASEGYDLLGGASFDINVPHVPGRSLEGVPNADTPEMREKIRNRLLRNPGGQEDLPGFLKKAVLPGDIYA
jgi:hypothetical protein